MNYLYDKKTVLRLCALACLSIGCAVYPSEVSLSTDSTSSASATDASPKRWSLPSLESVSDLASETAALPSKQLEESSVSTGSSSSSSGLKRLLADNNQGLESVHEESSWMSGTPSLESLAINRDRQEWWRYISDADRKAYQAKDPETQQKFRDIAQILRNHVETIENSRAERLDNKESITRTPLPDILDSFEEREEQDLLPELQGNLATLEE